MAILAAATAVVLGGGGLIAVGLQGDEGGLGAGLLPSSLTGGEQAPSAAPSPTGPSPEELAAIERAKRVKALDTALKKVAADAPDFSVAVLDRTTGERYAYRGAEKYETASIVKVQILACVLLQAQDEERKPTSGELSLARPMIRVSDNDATTSLFSAVGGRSGLSGCNKRLGLTQTTVSSSWGLTRTTVNDQVKLLGALVDEKGPLDTSSRKTAFTLMSTVDSEQDWGVTAAGKAAETTTVKNGWLPLSTDGNLWIINTVGRVTSTDGATDVSIAVLTHENTTMESGIKLTEKVAKLTRTHLKY